MQILFCSDPGIVRIIYLIKVFLNLTKFMLPIGLILMITIDLYKNLLHGHANNKDSVIKKAGKRIIACIFVFCVPTLVNLIFSLMDKVDLGNDNEYNTSFATCYNEANLDLINQLDEARSLKLKTEEEEKRKKTATLAAEFKAKLAAIIEKNKTNSSNKSSYSSTLTDLNKQNNVYIKNGVFYIPKFVKGKASTYSGKDCPSDSLNEGYNNKYGYNNYFWEMLQAFKKGAIDNGYNIDFGKQGCRSYKYQYYIYYDKYANQPGRAAFPGKSRHGYGIASDVTFYKDENTKCSSGKNYTNCPGMKWAHEHAEDYGLTFPLLNATYKENWHLEPLNLEVY